MDPIRYKLNAFSSAILDGVYIAQDATRVAITEYGGTREEEIIWDFSHPYSWDKHAILSGITSLLYDGVGKDMYKGFELCYDILTPDPR